MLQISDNKEKGILKERKMDHKSYLSDINALLTHL